MKKITFILMMMLCGIPMFAQGIPEITFNIEEGETINILEKRYIHVSVSVPEGQDSKSEILLEGAVNGEDGRRLSVGGLTTFENGVDVGLARFSSGVSYVIEMTKVCYGSIIGYEEVTHNPIYEHEIKAEDGGALASAHFQIVADTEEIEVISVEYKSADNALYVTFDAEDACQTEMGDFLLEKADGTSVDVFVEGTFGENYGDMVYTFSQPLADGDYVLVLPAKTMTFSKSGKPYNAEVLVPFTVGTSTDIIQTTSVKAANAKVVENGKLVIMKNDVKYNVAGVELK